MESRTENMDDSFEVLPGGFKALAVGVQWFSNGSQTCRLHSTREGNGIEMESLEVSRAFLRSVE